MKTLRGILAALTFVFAPGAQAREPDVAGLRAYALPGYTVITHEKRASGWIADRTAIVDQVLSKLLASPKQASGTQTYIYAMRKSVWQTYLRRGDGIASDFIPGRFANYLLLGASVDEFAVSSAISHEYTHHYLQTQFRGGLPLWFDEGLATLMTFTRMRLGIATVGNPYFGDHASRRIPMERLLRIGRSSPEFLTTPTVWGIHEQSWGMVHKGLIDDGRFGGHLFAYLRAIDDMRPIDAAVTENFNMTVPELDRQITKYLHQPAFARMEIPYDPPRLASPREGREIGELEALEFIATVMLDGNLNSTRVKEVVDAAAQRAPDAASVAVLRMRMAVRDRDDAALTSLLETMRREPESIADLRGPGLALFERVRDDTSGEMPNAQRDAWRVQAHAMLNRSLAANPDDAEAAWAFGMLSASLNRDQDLAMRRLQRASELIPRNADLAKAQALLYEANGQSAEMIPHLVNIAAYTSSIEERQWAKERIADVKARQKTAP